MQRSMPGDPPQYQELPDPMRETARGALSGASSGNPWVAGGMAGLSFMQAQQDRKRIEAQNKYEAQRFGATSQAELLNSALDRYMKAVS